MKEKLNYLLRIIFTFPKLTLGLIVVDLLQAASFARLIFLVGEIMADSVHPGIVGIILPAGFIICSPILSYLMLRIGLQLNHHSANWPLEISVVRRLSPSFCGRAVISLCESVSVPSMLISAPLAALVFAITSTNNTWTYSVSALVSLFPIIIIYLGNARKVPITQRVVGKIEVRSSAFSNWIGHPNSEQFPHEEFQQELNARRDDTIYEEVIAIAPNAILTLISVVIWQAGWVNSVDIVAIYFTSQYIVSAFQSLSVGYILLARLDRFMLPLGLD